VLADALGQAREAREHALDVGADPGAVAPAKGPGHEVLAHRERREHEAVFRHQRQAPGHDLRRSPAHQLLALEEDRAALGPQDARQRHHERGLARAVGPEQAGDLAGARLQAHALERLDLAVGRGQFAYLQHRALPQAASAADSSSSPSSAPR
jgi:hypothetical protein